MKSREKVDPELHILRTVATRAEGRERHALESARFNLYAAFENGDPDAAARWAGALRVAIVAWTPEGEEDKFMRSKALDALRTIEKAVGEAP